MVPFYLGEVGQYYSGANIESSNLAPRLSQLYPTLRNANLLLRQLRRERIAFGFKALYHPSPALPLLIDLE